MNARQTRWLWGTMLLAVVVAVAMQWRSESTAQDAAEAVAEPVAPTDLLSADTVLFVQMDGAKDHREAWEQTAAYEAMKRARLDAITRKLEEFVRDEIGVESNDTLEQFLAHLNDHGLSVSVSVPSSGALPTPQLTLVLHNAAKHADTLKFLIRTASDGMVEFQEEKFSGRTVYRTVVPQTPGLEISWWVEGDHVMATAGLTATTQAMSVLSGDRPGLTDHRLMEQVNGGDIDVTTRVWFDMSAVRARFGQFPVPTPGGDIKTVNQVLGMAGLESVDAFTSVSGYDGKSMASDSQLIFDGEPTGLMTLVAQRNIGWDEVPPLPSEVNAFFVSTFDMAKAFDTIHNTVKELATLAPPGADQELARGLAQVNSAIGFDLREDLFGSMGDVCCVYGDPNQGFFGTGGAIVLKVNDEEKFNTCLATLFETLARETRGDFATRSVEKHGRKITMFEFDRMITAGSLMVADGWCVISLMPQAAEAFALRLDGELPSWDREKSAVHGDAPLPTQFSSVAYIDPEPAYHAIAKIAPFAISALTVALKEERLIPRDMQLPITPADLPIPELFAASLYPNVSSAHTTADRVKWSSRSSVPAIPLISGLGGGDALATSAVMTGLLIPAVRQARVAAKRTQSKNNLKILGLAMHNYHDSYRSFPAGTVPNEKLKVDERLSFIVPLLPFMDQSPLYDQVDMEAGWEDKPNQRISRTIVPYLMNPGDPQRKISDAAHSGYIGMAGVGKDAAELPARHERAGIFGYNRSTRIADIRDGTSNTIMITETNDATVGWAQGGQKTIRSLTKKPYVNGPDGIGGPFPGVVQVLFADGSVRAISEDIDTGIFESLMTINGGEVIPRF